MDPDPAVTAAWLQADPDECRLVDLVRPPCSAYPRLFWPAERERGEDRRARQAAAKRVCETCPAMLNCRETARARSDVAGDSVMGGETPEERSALGIKAAWWVQGTRTW